MEEAEVVEHFFGVYLLYCLNPKFKGRTYIGYTVNPRRRIKQHNGENLGGARKTSKKRPWNMVLIVHGFPSSTSALRFEWAWQHPELSRRLRHIPKKKSNQKVFDYCLLVLSEMLKVGPWCRLPLTLRWLDYQFYDNYSPNVTPPLHVPITCGKVVSRSLSSKSSPKKKKEVKVVSEDPCTMLCSLCDLYVSSEDKVTCVKSDCNLIGHLICLAKVFNREDKMLLPLVADCPACKTNILWGDLIRKKLGCNLHLDNTDSKSGNDSDSLSD